MSMVHLSAGMNPPASPQLLSEPAIVARLAAATLPSGTVGGGTIPWLSMIENYDRIRERIARVVPGFEDFNARVHKPRGFHLHHPCRERVFPTASGQAMFIAHPLTDARSDESAIANDPITKDDPRAAVPLLRLMTIRSHDQYNTTIYGRNDRYRGVHDLRRVCFISRHDLAAHGFADGDEVDLISVWDDGERIARGFRLVEYDIPPGCLASYFPETNPLVPLQHHAERARTPASKAIPVRLRRSAGTGAQNTNDAA